MVVAGKESKERLIEVV
jgi:intraflagellar transport protein 56